MTKTIHIEGMSCSHCVSAVKKALEGLGGVSAVTVDLEGKQAVLEAAGTVSDAALTAAIDDAGFDVVSIQ